MVDRVLGAAGLSAAVAAYVYYTAWVVVTPFIDPDVVWFHRLFPDRWCASDSQTMRRLKERRTLEESTHTALRFVHRWAIAVPTVLLIFTLACITAFIGSVSLRSR